MRDIITGGLESTSRPLGNAGYLSLFSDISPKIGGCLFPASDNPVIEMLRRRRTLRNRLRGIAHVLMVKVVNSNVGRSKYR